MFLSAHQLLRCLKQILNNDKSYLDKCGHLSHYLELHWTVPMFSANYLQVNVAKQYQKDWGFSEKQSIARYVQDERVWLTRSDHLLVRPSVRWCSSQSSVLLCEA